MTLIPLRRPSVAVLKYEVWLKSRYVAVVAQSAPVNGLQEGRLTVMPVDVIRQSLLSKLTCQTARNAEKQHASRLTSILPAHNATSSFVPDAPSKKRRCTDNGSDEPCVGGTRQWSSMARHSSKLTESAASDPHCRHAAMTHCSQSSSVLSRVSKT